MLKFKSGWNKEKSNYVSRYGNYSGFLDAFNEGAITKAIYNASRSSSSRSRANSFLQIAADPFDRKVITIEQGTHQAEGSSGFFLHFTGRDNRRLAFHLYVRQNAGGILKIFKITCFQNGRLSTVRL